MMYCFREILKRRQREILTPQFRSPANAHDKDHTRLLFGSYYGQSNRTPNRRIIEMKNNRNMAHNIKGSWTNESFAKIRPINSTTYAKDSHSTNSTLLSKTSTHNFFKMHSRGHIKLVQNSPSLGINARGKKPNFL